MYNRLKKLFNNNRLTEKELDNAVTKGWITDAEKAEIISGKGTENGR